MTTEVILAARQEGAFSRRSRPGAESFDPLSQFETLYVIPGVGELIKRTPGKNEALLGFLINTGPKIIHLKYRKVLEGGRRIEVGPSTDYILPGHCKECGMGPGMEWELTEV